MWCAWRNAACTRPHRVQHSGASRFILRNQPATPPARVAIVTGRDADYGLARMLEVYRQDPRTAFRVTRDLDEALEWTRSAAGTPPGHP